jgi:DNA polymerase-3 subunit gamma/tau
VSLALYRRYRPETFAEVIGQDQVTAPLQQAIRNDRVHHAYLFSGPRGCGKTTSARLLARCLNCEKGPTPEPCGECQSCRDLARGGSGSIDVVEIDAASHGGVDDARDLRERAFFAPAVSRYKIYIVDEAHMVTMAGFNALLKVVEEPPPHLKFVFATTEPDKVIPTIRSRTHHYPFRLVPPSVMRDYLARLCDWESVAVEPAVLPLVVRAGAGSVRDALSVLDQLIAGAGESGVTYALATDLLGFTDAQLLDDVIDAFAAGDGAGVFKLLERVIEGGHDPRRFAQDLLERLRDLVILSAMPDAESTGLIDAPADQLERMRQQAGNLGLAELTRAADIVNVGLTEMRGATAPRLQLELICARVLLPGADDDERGLHARIDRLERRFSIGALRPAVEQLAAGAVGADTPQRGGMPGEPASGSPAAPGSDVESGRQVARRSPSGRAEPSGQPRGRAAARGDADDSVVASESAGPASSSGAATASAGPTPVGVAAGLDLAGARRMWPDILEVVKAKRRFTWLMLLDHVQVVGLSDGVLTLAFANEGQRKNFVGGGSDEILRQAIHQVLGTDWQIDTVLDPAHASGSGSTPRASTSGQGGEADTRRRSGTTGRSGSVADASAAEAEPTSGHSSGRPGRGSRGTRASKATGAGTRGAKPEAASVSPAAPADAAAKATGHAEASPVPQQRAEHSTSGDRPAHPADAGDKTLPGAQGLAEDPDAHAAPDDDDLVDGGLAGADLLAQELGATLIDEIDRHQD